MVSNQAFIGPPAMGISENSRSEMARLKFDISPPRLAARQKSARRLRASSGPPRARPSANMMALTAPADAPEIPSIVSRPSSRRWSSTPQVNAPSAPPPCSARLMRLPAFGFSDLPPPNARARSSIIAFVSLRHPAAVNRVGGAGDRRRRIAAQEDGECSNTLWLRKLEHRLFLREQRYFGVAHALARALGSRVDLLLDQRCKYPS